MSVSIFSKHISQMKALHENSKPLINLFFPHSYLSVRVLDTMRGILCFLNWTWVWSPKLCRIFFVLYPHQHHQDKNIIMCMHSYMICCLVDHPLAFWYILHIFFKLPPNTFWYIMSTEGMPIPFKITQCYWNNYFP